MLAQSSRLERHVALDNMCNKIWYCLKMSANGWEVLAGRAGHAALPDVDAFLDTVECISTSKPRDSLSEQLKEATECLKFRWDQPLYVARAPGRLDVMGGIADYSGSLVLQMPIEEACLVALQCLPSAADSQPTLRVASLSVDAGHRSATYQVAMEALFPGGAPLAYENALAFFKVSRTAVDERPLAQWRCVLLLPFCHTEAHTVQSSYRRGICLP